MYTIAYDVERRRPACVLNQRMLGATVPSGVLALMDGWVVDSFDGMQVFTVETPEQERALIAITNEGSHAHR